MCHLFDNLVSIFFKKIVTIRICADAVFLNNNSKSLPEVLHGDTRHIVCRKCITTIGKECPFCRAPLGKNSAAAASAAIVAPDAAAGKKGF